MNTMNKAEQAFWDILATGVAPSVASVRAKLDGKGSHKQIQEAVKSCWETLGQDIAYFRRNPDIPNEILSMAHEIWFTARKLSGKSLEEGASND